MGHLWCRISLSFDPAPAIPLAPPSRDLPVVAPAAGGLVSRLGPAEAARVPPAHLRDSGRGLTRQVCADRKDRADPGTGTEFAIEMGGKTEVNHRPIVQRQPGAKN